MGVIQGRRGERNRGREYGKGRERWKREREESNKGKRGEERGRNEGRRKRVRE